MQRLVLATVVVALGFSLCRAFADSGDSWIVLSDDLTAWRQPAGEWCVAGNAHIDPKNDRRLTGEPGHGVLINGKEGRTKDLVTRQLWGDVEVRLEFMIPRRSNSGVKLEGVYEVQIVDSWKVAKPKGDDCGGIYPRAELKPKYHHIDDGIAPLTNAAKQPGEWQTLEIVFRAPRFDAKNEKVANARFEKVVLNGKLIHDHVEIAYPTGHMWREKEKPAGPLLLQADHGPVAFRNVRVRALPAVCAAQPVLELVSSERIWNQAPYNSFGDLIRYRDHWFCSFRQGNRHVAKRGQEDNGKIRLISSIDGKAWTSAALIEEPGTDLRDPHLSVTADGRLMIVAGGSQYPGGVYQERQPRVMFSADGVRWTQPQRILEPGHWLWRVTWRQGKAYGISKYGSVEQEIAANPRRQNLVCSEDGIHWKIVAELKVPGGDEATVRFLPDGRMVALIRRELPDHWSGDGPRSSVEPRSHASIGVSSPPYQDWQWHTTNHFVGGPNFIVLPSGLMVGGGRFFQDDNVKTPRTGVGCMTLESLEPELWLPSGGDNGYEGFLYHDGLLWTSYYSSHEGNPAVYLAKIRIKECQ